MAHEKKRPQAAQVSAAESVREVPLSGSGHDVSQVAVDAEIVRDRRLVARPALLPVRHRHLELRRLLAREVGGGRVDEGADLLVRREVLDVAEEREPRYLDRAA